MIAHSHIEGWWRLRMPCRALQHTHTDDALVAPVGSSHFVAHAYTVSFASRHTTTPVSRGVAWVMWCCLLESE